LARCKPEDIDAAWNALKVADKPRIHTFISTSDIHLKYQFKMTREQALERAIEMVTRAKGYVKDVEFSPMDATRTEEKYLYKMLEAVIEAGATTVNIPDTVGYSIPHEFGQMIKGIKENVPNIKKAVISVHCHNDLGLATANSLAALKNGASQVECTINGLGERAGNAALEEIVMAVKTRKDFFHLDSKVNTKAIMKTSRMVSRITGLSVQSNKSIVGANAFAHEAGIHQDGVLKEKLTYEIMSPESIGLTQNKLVLGKHSGRHAFRKHLESMGYAFSDDETNGLFEKFKNLADQKKEIFEEDLEAIIADDIYRIPEHYCLKDLFVSSGTNNKPIAKITMSVGDKDISEEGKGDGPVDAAFSAIKTISKTNYKLKSYSVKSITGGTDAQGEVSVRLKDKGIIVNGSGADTDIIIASAKAFINALNRMQYKILKKKLRNV
jgi:2-isopropylmalate synthase